ncbi:DUF47 domain-containing protein [Fibrobacterota bacterium]
MFLPKKSKVLEMISAHASIVHNAAQLFQITVSDSGELEAGCHAMKKLENQADRMVQKITDEIERVFILPFDKEDVREITELIDDVIDNMEQTVNRIKIYKINTANECMGSLSKLLLEAVKQIRSNINLIEDSKIKSDEFAAGNRKIHELESRGDEVHRKILEDLFNNEIPGLNGNDPISIIKWKEIFQLIEDTFDICEDVAVVLERLRVKYS